VPSGYASWPSAYVTRVGWIAMRSGTSSGQATSGWYSGASMCVATWPGPPRRFGTGGSDPDGFEPLGQQMGQGAPQIPADPSGTRFVGDRLKTAPRSPAGLKGQATKPKVTGSNPVGRVPRCLSAVTREHQDRPRRARRRPHGPGPRDPRLDARSPDQPQWSRQGGVDATHQAAIPARVPA